MPKTKLAAKFNTPKVNFLAGSLKAYKRANEMTDEDVAKAVGLEHRETACRKMNQCADDWNIGELRKFCNAVKMPLSEAFEAILKG